MSDTIAKLAENLHVFNNMLLHLQTLTPDNERAELKTRIVAMMASSPPGLLELVKKTLSEQQGFDEMLGLIDEAIIKQSEPQKTGFDKFLEKEMLKPEFAKEYERAKKEIEDDGDS